MSYSIPEPRFGLFPIPAGYILPALFFATTHKIFNLITLDERGSLESIKAPVTFNRLEIRTRLDNQPADQLTELTDAFFSPDAGTPLYDAMGRSLIRMEWLTEKETNYKDTRLAAVLFPHVATQNPRFYMGAVRLQ